MLIVLCGSRTSRVFLTVIVELIASKAYAEATAGRLLQTRCLSVNANLLLGLAGAGTCCGAPRSGFWPPNIGECLFAAVVAWQ
jgi:hypothetical protein